MREVYRFDVNGFYVEPVHLRADEEVPEDCVEEKPGSFLKAKINGDKWEEGATEAELEAVHNAVPYNENEQLKKRIEELENTVIMLMDQSLL